MRTREDFEKGDSRYIGLSTIKRKRRAVYAGSFDPLTMGHAWMIRQGMSMFDELIVAIGENPLKKTTFSLAERLDMLEKCIPFIKEGSFLGGTYYDDAQKPVQVYTPTVEVDSFSNQYLVNYAKQKDADFILRGIRNIHDFEYERTIRQVNSDLDGGLVTTTFLIPPRNYSELSSSFVKALCGPKYWEEVVQSLVLPPVYEKLLEHFKGKAPSNDDEEN